MNSIFLLNETNQAQLIKQAHFNLWMVGNERFLDVGLRMVRDQRIELYLPWNNAVISDLYDTLKDGDVLNAIFNQHLTVTQTTGLGYTTVTRGTDVFDVVKVKDITATPFVLHNTTHSNAYTKITIEPDKLTPNDSYIRLRAKGFGNDVFNTTHVCTGSFLNPYRESIEAVDFRVNEIRTVTPSDFKKTAVEIPVIQDLHFFLLKSFHETNSLSSPPYTRCRELEDKAWVQYLALSQENKVATLAYHWKKSLSKGEHFSILATFGEKKASWLIVFFYVVIIVILNLFSTFTYEKMAPQQDLGDCAEQQSVPK